MVVAGDRVKAAVYLRVSSRDGRQDESNQEPECLELCRARGWAPLVFRERESGVKARPVWREVLELARRGHVRAVVVWALDRIGRTRVQVAHDLAELLRWRVDVVSVRDGWLDQAGPMRDLLVQIFGWVAEGERQRLIERTHAGLARARAKGKVLGRRPRLTGRALEHAVLARGRGWSWSMVVAALEHDGYGRFSRGAVQKAVSRKGTDAAAANPGPDAGLEPPRQPVSN